MLGIGLLLDDATAHVKASLELFPALDAFGARNERLEDRRHTGARRRAEVVGIDGNLTPEKKGKPLLCAAFLEDALGHAHPSIVLREEEHGDTVVPLVGKKVTALLRLLAEKVMGNLEENAGSVTGVVLQTLAAAMLEIDENR